MLIANNRVIADYDSVEYFGLVEGITYKIVHSFSGSNLNSDDNGACILSASNLDQYWSLRNVEGHIYNIISLKSGMNLCCNGRNLYDGVPTSNTRQHWTFTKINNDIYNIINSESLNLDGDGRHLYISAPEHNSMANGYQHWLFEPSNFNLTAEVIDFVFPPNLKNNLDQYKTSVDLGGYYVFENHANETTDQTIDKTVTKSNLYTLEIRKSDSFEVTENIDMSFNLGTSIFETLGINTGFVGGIKREFRSSHEKGCHEKVYSESVIETISYHINQKITVPPSKSVKINSTVDKISIQIPFQAKIRVAGKADRLDENGSIVPMTDVGVNALRCYLRKEKYNSRHITVEGNSLIIDTSGTLKVEGYGDHGLNTRIEAIPIR